MLANVKGIFIAFLHTLHQIRSISVLIGFLMHLLGQDIRIHETHRLHPNDPPFLIVHLHTVPESKD